jgi:hypothetical protein
MFVFVAFFRDRLMNDSLKLVDPGFRLQRVSAQSVP